MITTPSIAPETLSWTSRKTQSGNGESDGVDSESKNILEALGLGRCGSRRVCRCARPGSLESESW